MTDATQLRIIIAILGVLLLSGMYLWGQPKRPKQGSRTGAPKRNAGGERGGHYVLPVVTASQRNLARLEQRLAIQPDHTVIDPGAGRNRLSRTEPERCRPREPRKPDGGHVIGVQDGVVAGLLVFEQLAFSCRIVGEGVVPVEMIIGDVHRDADPRLLEHRIAAVRDELDDRVGLVAVAAGPARDDTRDDERAQPGREERAEEELQAQGHGVILARKVQSAAISARNRPAALSHTSRWPRSSWRRMAWTVASLFLTRCPSSSTTILR